jgi:signal transduction histidine kinase
MALYRLRVRQIARSISTRFDERLAERTRMARDLHDTFLQTIEGSKLIADDALEASTDPIRMRRAMEQLSVWLSRAMHEGRTALNSLRTANAERNDLAEALQRVTEDSLIPSKMGVAFSAVGDAREMHPIVRDEIYRIGYEAIRNACTHSSASRLEVELSYANDLALRVSDDGTVIDPVIADKGRDGHFGLQGMRERAARIGGKLTLGSSSNSGTEIRLLVPGASPSARRLPFRGHCLLRSELCLRGPIAHPTWTERFPKTLSGRFRRCSVHPNSVSRTTVNRRSFVGSSTLWRSPLPTRTLSRRNERVDELATDAAKLTYSFG